MHLLSLLPYIIITSVFILLILQLKKRMPKCWFRCDHKECKFTLISSDETYLQFMVAEHKVFHSPVGEDDVIKLV